MRSALASSFLPLYLSVGALCVGFGIQIAAQHHDGRHALPKLVSALHGSERLAAMEDSARQELAEFWAKAPSTLGPRTESFILRRGDTLNDVLTRAGLSSTTVADVTQAVHEIYNPKRMQAGQAVEVSYDLLNTETDVAPTRLSFDVAPGHRVDIERQQNGAYQAKDVVATTRHVMTRADGTITSSLFEAAEQQHLPADVLAAFVKMFSYDVDFQRDLQKGDRFEVMFDREITTDGQAVRNGGIRYASLTVSGTPMRFFAFRTPDGEIEYYNEKGEGIRKALLRTPVNGATLTSSFGMRKNPILGYTVMHRGVDFGAPSGTPIMAAGDGVIDKRELSSSYGNYIRIRHSSGYETAYAHMSRFGTGMSVGKRVRQGDIIGYVGATGHATGPHLHFEVLRDAQQVNPISVKFPSAMKLDGALLTRFRNERDSVMQAYAGLNDPQVAQAPAEGATDNN